MRKSTMIENLVPEVWLKLFTLTILTSFDECKCLRLRRGKVVFVGCGEVNKA